MLDLRRLFTPNFRKRAGGARFVMALGLGAPYARPHSTHSLGGLFGAAAGALLGLNARQLRFQLSYARQLHSDPRRLVSQERRMVGIQEPAYRECRLTE
jgi:hypothetical protein